MNIFDLFKKGLFEGLEENVRQMDFNENMSRVREIVNGLNYTMGFPPDQMLPKKVLEKVPQPGKIVVYGSGEKPWLMHHGPGKVHIHIVSPIGETIPYYTCSCASSSLEVMEVLRTFSKISGGISFCKTRGFIFTITNDKCRVYLQSSWEPKFRKTLNSMWEAFQSKGVRKNGIATHIGFETMRLQEGTERQEVESVQWSVEAFYDIFREFRRL